jgi:hypothetical protein
MLDNTKILDEGFLYLSVIAFIILLIGSITYSNSRYDKLKSNCLDGLVVRTIDGWRCIEAKVLE